MFLRDCLWSQIFTTGNISWVDKLLSDECSYTFAHKHLLSDDMHSHTANGKEEVLGQLSKTSRSWSDVKITSTDEVQPGKPTTQTTAKAKAQRQNGGICFPRRSSVSLGRPCDPGW